MREGAAAGGRGEEEGGRLGEAAGWVGRGGAKGAASGFRAKGAAAGFRARASPPGVLLADRLDPWEVFELSEVLPKELRGSESKERRATRADFVGMRALSLPREGGVCLEVVEAVMLRSSKETKCCFVGG